MSLNNTILIVEPEPAIVDLLVDLFTDEGYITCSAPTGTRGLATILLDPPAITLFDMALPDMSASELIHQLQALGRTNVRLVLMSTLPHDVALLLVPNMIDYLSKPFDIDILLRLVARHVAPRRAVYEGEELADV